MNTLKMTERNTTIVDLRSVTNVKLVDAQDDVAIYSSTDFVKETCEQSNCKGLFYTGDEL
jgi:hypothetical protein